MKGGLHDHPAPLNTLHRLRMIILGKNTGVVQSSTNHHIVHTNEAESEFIMATTLRRADISVRLLEKNIDGGNVLIENNQITNITRSREPNQESDGLRYIAGNLSFTNKY